MTTCTKCKTELETRMFGRQGEYFDKTCKACRALIAKERRRRIRENNSDAATSDGPRCCNGCERTLPAVSFGIAANYIGGRNPRCLECVAQYRRSGKEGMRLLLAEKSRAYRSSHKESTSAYHKRYRDSNPYRSRSRRAVRTAVERGELIKLPCEVCGSTTANAHHDSYERDKWLSVRWLCVKHHKQHHALMDRRALDGEVTP